MTITTFVYAHLDHEYDPLNTIRISQMVGLIIDRPFEYMYEMVFMHVLSLSVNARVCAWTDRSRAKEL